MSRVQPHDENEAQAVVLNVCLEDDITEGTVTKKEKGKKASVKELQQRIAELEVKLEIARPEHIEKMIESHRNAQLTIRDLNYHLRERDNTIIRLNARIQELEQGTDNQKHDASTDNYQFAQLEQERDQWHSRCTQVEQEKASLLIDNQDLRQTNTYLEQRDRNHLEAEAEWFQENTELQDEVSILAAEITTLKTEKHDALTEQNKEWCEACKLHSEMQVKQQQVEAVKRGIKRLPYKKMDSSDKHVAIDYVEQAAARSWDLAGLSLPFHPVMEQMAVRLGLSEAQLTRINKTQKKAGAWTHDVKREFKERIGKKEIYNCTVTVSLDKILSDPESLQKPEGPKGSHQGGARVRRCKDCGSDDMDRYALEYCRSCKKAHLQLLPGLRSDANALDTLDAVKQDRVTIQDHVFEYSQQDQDEQKHDAFTQEEVQELNAQLENTIHQVDTQLTTQTTQPPQILTEIELQHDACSQKEVEKTNTFLDPIHQIPTESEQKHHASPIIVSPHQTQLPQLQPFPTEPEHDAFVKQRPGQDEQKHDAFTQTQAEIPTEVKQEHDAFTGQHTQDTEQSPLIESKMQSRVTVKESLHDALAEGTRVDTPVGLATVRVVRYFENLEVPRWRCAVRTDTAQPNGSRFAVFDMCQVQPIRQVVLL